MRIDAEFGVGYDSDLRRVRALAVEAAQATTRVVATPAPVCHITGFGDNAVTLVLRFWIDDPVRGVTNIKGDVFLALWDAFKAHGIELPFPQRELHLRSIAPAVAESLQRDEPRLQRDPAEPKRVADDEQRTGAHRRASQHWVQQDAGERV